MLRTLLGKRMFRDFGFIWYLFKDLLKVAAWMLWVVSMFFMHTAPNPWDWICFAYGIGGFLYWWVPLTKDVIQNKYKTYREEKEKAWEVLKETK